MFHPHPYQAAAIKRILGQSSVGLFMDMGLGKTVVTLTAIDRLVYDYMCVRRVLVIAPKKVAEATWQDEAAKWDHLKRLRISTALGSEQRRSAAVFERSDIVVINRENVAWLVDSFCNGLSERPTAGRAEPASAGAQRQDAGETRAPQSVARAWGEWPFDMVVVDESSSFKSPSSKRFKALKRMLPKIKSVVILTGTPAPNGIEDLWSQVYLLDRGERLGKYVTHYRARYFDYNPWRHAYIPKPGAFEAVQAKIADLCVSMKAADYLQLPELVIHDVPVALGEREAALYRQMEREMVMEVGEEGTTSSDPAAPGHLPLKGKALGDDGTVEISAISAAALTNKLLQLCGGCVYGEDGEAFHVHDAKLEALTELLESLGEPVLLFYGFRHELPGLRAAAMRNGRRVRELKSAEDAQAWNRGEVDVLLAHPASCAYGLNLQDGGRHVVWFTLTWSLELYQQANARLYRQGQEKPVIVHRLLVKGGVDEDVAKALEGKSETQDALIEALKARIERVSA